MDFYAVLDQIRDLLQRRRRVTYRALKVQFQLDDEHLEALTEELIDAEGVATDEQGKVLVWTGGAGAPMQPAPPTPASAAQEDQPLQAAASSAASTTSEAERRQLTVLFCDLADSTRLARHLDPEDLRDVIRAYQTTCVAVIQRFAGHVAQYLGDGLLVYFGYPQAHEDDAQRAVRTGLGMLEAMETLNIRLARDHGVRLTVRVGIHTGLVVVGEMGSGGRHEHLALGGYAESGRPPPGTGGAGYGRGQCGHLPPSARLFYHSRVGRSQYQGDHGTDAGVSHAGGKCSAEPPGHRRPERLNAPGGT
jgi:class 3 adenylate cyclase